MGCKIKSSFLLTCDTEGFISQKGVNWEGGGGGGRVIILQGQTGKFLKLYRCSSIRPSVKYGSPSSIKITF